MKLAKTFIVWFAIVALVVFLVDVKVFNFSEIIMEHLNSFANKRLSADRFPLAVFLLLFTSTLLELALLFRLSLKWLEKAKENSQKRLVNISGGLLGGLSTLTGLAYARGNVDETKLGLSVILIVILYVAAPLFIAGVLYMLRDPDSNPNRMKLIKWVAAITYLSILVISLLGIYRSI